MSDQFHEINPRRHRLGEGARFLGSGFVFVDILDGSLFATDGMSSPGLVLQIDTFLGAVAPARSGGLVLAAGTGFALWDRDVLNWVAHPEADANRPARMNDASVDPAGRFWAGSMALDAAEGAGSLYRLDPDLTVTKVLDGLTVPNGPTFDAHRSLMYLADSHAGVISRYRCDPDSGTLGDAETFAHIEDASPDGMTVDADGNLWVALWGGSRLHQYTPSGRLSRVVGVPARQPTSIAFGTRSTSPALVTTATYELADPTDSDGRTLVANLGVEGTAPTTFGR